MHLRPAGVIVDWTEPIFDPGIVVHLDDVERGRYDSYRRPDDRARFATGRWLLKRRLSPLLETPEVRLDASCARCGGPHGVPTVPGSALRISVSHSGDRVVVAVSEAPVGVDVEQVRRVDHDRLARAILSGPELAAYERLGADVRNDHVLRCWVRKEALLKSLQKGLAYPMGDVTLRSSGGGIAVEGWPFDDPPTIVDLDLGARHAAALATAPGAAVSVHHVAWYLGAEPLGDAR